MKSKILGLLAVALLAGPITARAVTVTISGTGEWDGQWEITTLTGSYLDLEATLLNQAWWRDYELAGVLSVALGGALGYPNVGAGGNDYSDYAPYFVYVRQGDGFMVRGLIASQAFPVFVGRSVTREFVFAISDRVRVPEAGTLAPLGLGLAGLGLSRRRKA